MNISTYPDKKKQHPHDQYGNVYPLLKTQSQISAFCNFCLALSYIDEFSDLYNRTNTYLLNSCMNLRNKEWNRNDYHKCLLTTTKIRVTIRLDYFCWLNSISISAINRFFCNFNFKNIRSIDIHRSKHFSSSARFPLPYLPARAATQKTSKNIVPVHFSKYYTIFLWFKPVWLEGHSESWDPRSIQNGLNRYALISYTFPKCIGLHWASFDLWDQSVWIVSKQLSVFIGRSNRVLSVGIVQSMSNAIASHTGIMLLNTWL